MTELRRVKIVDSSDVYIDENNRFPVETQPSGSPDTGNSTSTLLGAGVTFTGVGVDVTNYLAITILTYSDVASATDGLVVQFSADNSNWHDGEKYTIVAGATKFFTPPVQSQYMRVKYTNGASPQGNFHLHTMLKAGAIKWSSHNIGDEISSDDDAQLIKSVITGENDNGAFTNVAVSNSNRLKVVSQTYGYAVAEEDIPNHTGLLKFGTRTSVAAGTSSTVWEGPTALYQYMSTAQQLKVSSNSVNDTSAGTGARTLKLIGLDTNFDEVEETITLNGTTVVTTTLSYIRIFRAYVVTCGTGYTNAGIITVTNNAGTTTQLIINAGDGQTLMTLWTVPRGKTLYITRGSTSTDSNKGARISLFVRKLDGGTLYPWLIKYRGFIFSGATDVPFEIPFKVLEKTDIELRVLTPGSAGVTSVGGTFAGWYETD